MKKFKLSNKAKRGYMILGSIVFSFVLGVTYDRLITQYAHQTKGFNFKDDNIDITYYKIDDGSYNISITNKGTFKFTPEKELVPSNFYKQVKFEGLTKEKALKSSKLLKAPLKWGDQ